MGWMRPDFRIALVLAAAALAAAVAEAGDKPRAYIRWAESWGDAVDEARALNLPIVVHRHGFY